MHTIFYYQNLNYLYIKVPNSVLDIETYGTKNDAFAHYLMNNNFQLQKQIKEQYTQKTLVLNATTQIDTNMKEKDKSMNNIVNKDTQYITDTVNNNLILDPHSDIETIKDIFNSISNTKISSHTKQMLQIIFNSYSNLKKENESLKQKL